MPHGYVHRVCLCKNSSYFDFNLRSLGIIGIPNVITNTIPIKDFSNLKVFLSWLIIRINKFLIINLIIIIGCFNGTEIHCVWYYHKVFLPHIIQLNSSQHNSIPIMNQQVGVIFEICNYHIKIRCF